MRKRTVNELNRVGTEGFAGLPKLPVCVVLDQVRSAYNVGSVFRTCDAFAVDSLCLVGITPQPPQKEIRKTALGAEATVAWRYFGDMGQCLEELRRQGFIVVAVEQAVNAVRPEAVPWADGRKYALVFGHEVKGVSDAVVASADLALEIPQWGSKHSLNVSVCAGIVLWEAARSLRPATGQ